MQNHLWALMAATALLPSVAALILGGGVPTLTLHRLFPVDKRVKVSQLKARDMARHGRILQPLDGVVNLPVGGSYDPYVAGVYYAIVEIGTPGQRFAVKIDTASDAMWVSCASCSNCPVTRLTDFYPHFYNATNSSTSHGVSCSDPKCKLGTQSSSESRCDNQNNRCSYTFKYENGTSTSGYYFSDLMRLELDTFSENNTLTVNTTNTAQIVFGCSMHQTGDLTKDYMALDGIIGFGQRPISIISQLSSQGITPPVFSHCLSGDSEGGGTLMLGEMADSDMVYTPLVPDQPHYKVYLESISVKGHLLPIQSSVFVTKGNTTGTLLDLGTTLAYTPFLDAINNAISHSTHRLSSKANQCYMIVNSSVHRSFPKVSLNFKGGTSMVLGPEDYLFEQDSVDNTSHWCMGVLKGQSMTILGDLVLKDKVIVYDLARQRIGWAPYNCSQAVYVNLPKTDPNTTASNTMARIKPCLFMKLGAVIFPLLLCTRWIM